MIECICDKGYIHGADGDQAWVEECATCNGTNEITLMQWATLNGWEFDGILCEIECKEGYYQLEENDTVYFVDRDFERFEVLRKATPESITNLLNADR